MWVEGDLNSCVKPTSIMQTFCQMNYTVPQIIVRRVTKTLHFIINNFAILQTQMSYTCRNSLKEVLCKGSLPKCSDDRKTASFLNYRSACSSLSSCGSNLVNLNGLNTQSLCQESGQQFTLTRCLKSPLTSLNTQYCGALPKDIAFPAWIQPVLFRQTAVISSLKSTFDSSKVSASCTNQWITMTCTSTPFCSSDRKKIVSGVTKQQCDSAISW